MSEEDGIEVDANFLGFLKKKNTEPAIPSRTSSSTRALAVIKGYEYKMDHKRRGKAIIFNHMVFNNLSMPRRSGSDLDVKTLSDVLKNDYGFEVQICVDYSYGKIYDTLHNASTDDYSDCDCILVVAMTHGENNKLWAKDTIYDTEELWLHFAGCKSLVGKPKLFFIQACRGEQLDSGHTVKFDSQSGNVGKIPKMADILVMYSSFEGFYSFRSPTKGSWFIQRLCEELKNTENNGKDIYQILTFVNRNVAFNDESYNPYNREFNKMKQVGTIVSSLTRMLYLTKATEVSTSEDFEMIVN